MPEQEITKNAWQIGPWVIGLFTYLLSLFGIAMRNELTTKKINTTLYNKNGDLRVIKKEDCGLYQKSLKESIQAEATARREDRIEVRDELKLIHEKIDNLPEKTIRLLKASK